MSLIPTTPATLAASPTATPPSSSAAPIPQGRSLSTSFDTAQIIALSVLGFFALLATILLLSAVTLRLLRAAGPKPATRTGDATDASERGEAALLSVEETGRRVQYALASHVDGAARDEPEHEHRRYISTSSEGSKRREKPVSPVSSSGRSSVSEMAGHRGSVSPQRVARFYGAEAGAGLAMPRAPERSLVAEGRGRGRYSYEAGEVMEVARLGR